MSGAPLNVPPWSPYSKQLALAEATSAAIGTPPPSPLPSVMMSGCDPRVLVPEEAARAPDARLDLVGDQQDARAPA